MFVKASHGSQSSLDLLDLLGRLLRSRLAPSASRLWDSPLYCFHSAYLWRILNFVSHTHTLFFQPLSWVILLRAPALLDEGQKHDCYEKAPDFLGLSFLNWPLSSPPERFLQIPVWGIVNTNFSLLKSPHIPAMLSFEWRTQGRPLNSFIVGFKTLHFKKYKSYSQMNEVERGGIDERGFWCVPSDGTGWIRLPKLLKCTLQWDGCSVPTTQLCTHDTHSLPQLPQKHTHMQNIQLMVCMLSALIVPNKLPHIHSRFHVTVFLFERPTHMINFCCWALMHLTFLCFQTPLIEKCFLCGHSVSINLVLQPRWNDTVLIKAVISCLLPVDGHNQRFDTKW